MAPPRVLSATAESATRIVVQFDQAMNEDVELTDIANYSASPSIPDFENATVSVLTNSSVAIVLSINMLSREQYTITVSQNITSAGLQVLDFQYLSVVFLGIGDNPQISAASALTNSTIQVTFSEPMRLLELSNSNNFFVASRDTGRKVAVTSSSPILDGDGYYRSTVLGIASTSKMTNGGLHILEARSLYDVVGNGGQTASGSFVGMADLPRVLSCEVFEEERQLRVVFDSPMSPIWAVAAGAYEIESDQSGVPSGFYDKAVLSEDQTAVTLDISELRIGAPYDIIATSIVRDEFGNLVNSEYNSSSFTGVGNIPVLTRAVAVGQNRMDLVFSEPIRDNAQSRDVSRYTADGGLSFLTVLAVDGDTVKLTTTDQTPGQNYTVTVT